MPSTPERDFFLKFVLPGLHVLEALGGPVALNPKAHQMLLTIFQQETGLKSRVQLVGRGKRGPAHGWGQFEERGGVAGVLTHHATKKLALALCEDQIVRPTAKHVWAAIEGNDTLAVGFSRLLLWSDPKPLPTSMAAGWDYYLRNWRPGKPKEHTWEGYWDQSLAALKDIQSWEG